MASYAIFVLFAGATAVRDASGIVEEVYNDTHFDCYSNRDCDWGLMNSYSVSKSVCNEQKNCIKFGPNSTGPQNKILNLPHF